VTRAEKVTKVIVTHTDKDFTDLSVITDTQPDGPSVPLTTTWHHPFWDVTHHRWTDAHDLTPGIRLRQPDGATATVTAVRNYHRRTVTYDLTIADLHSYYVLAGAAAVLVHNDTGASGTVFREAGYVFQIYANDHDPHGHLKGKGYDIRIGQNGKPLKGEPELNSSQQKLVEKYKSQIRSGLKKKMAEYNRNHPKDPETGERARC
jgi:hypothetical protein